MLKIALHLDLIEMLSHEVIPGKGFLVKSQLPCINSNPLFVGNPQLK